MLSENRTALGAYVAECFSVIVEEQHRLAIGHVGLNGLDQVVGIAVGEKQVEVAVVIVIEELEPPAAHQARCCADAGCVGLIIKSLVVVVLIERILFVIDVGDEEVQPSVLIEVGGIDSHAGSGTASLAETYSGKGGDFFELAVAAIHEEEVRGGIVGDEEVHAAIIVEVGGYRSPGFSEMLYDT